ncbi:MAG: hypothetical protein KBT29_02740 [Prevotellaceae bacterium]|nr:hypothetical protein [Candidatus Minthosoma caballi]
MEIVSFKDISEERLIDFAKYINGKYYCNYDKDLSFILLDEEQELMGFVLLRNNSIPDAYTIEQEVYTRENGVEILQIFCCNASNEPQLLKELVNRVTIWAYNGMAAFNYIWSIELNNATHFYADALNGDIHNAIISADIRQQLLYSLIPREEE